MDPGFNNGTWRLDPQVIDVDNPGGFKNGTWRLDPQVIDVDNPGEAQQSSAHVIDVDIRHQMPPTMTLSEAGIIAIYEPLHQAACQQQDFTDRMTQNALNNNGMPFQRSNYPTQSLAPLAPSQPPINVGQRLANTSNDTFLSSMMPPADLSVLNRGNDPPARKGKKLQDLETATLPHQLGLYSRVIRRGRFDQRHELMGAATACAFALNEVTGIKSDRNEMPTGEEKVKSEKHSHDDEGMFDDADEDVELPSVFLSMPVVPGPSNPGFATGIVAKSNERSTLESKGSDDDDAFDDAEDDITQKTVLDTGRAKKTDGAGLAPKTKKRQFSSLTKPIASQSPKEVTFATDLLSEKTELIHALPDDACRFLAESFWMFTVEQFEYVFEKSSVLYDKQEQKRMRDDIRDELAKSDLCAQDKSHSPGCDSPVKASIEVSLPGESMAERGSNIDIKSEPVMKNARHMVPSSKKLIPSVNDSTRDPKVNINMEKVDGSELNNDHSEAGDSKESVLHCSQPTHPALGVFEPTQAGTGAPSTDVSVDVTCTPQTTQEANGVASSILTTALSTHAMAVDTSSPVHAHLTDDKEDRTLCEARAEEPTASLLRENERSPGSDKRLQKAERLLETWMKRYSEWKNGLGAYGESTGDMKTSFSLKGPLGLLLPQLIRDFLASVTVTTAYELLSVRMTEASPLIRALYIWRQHCGLQSLKRTVLGRQMSGIVSRIETALSSVPPVDSFTRKWMGSSLVCLTAAAKEFLIDECKLETPKYFIDGQPKEFTEKLVAWREARKMPPLKGSGKIAMICSWKALIREFASADIGTGKLTTEDEIIELSIPVASNDGAEDGSDAPPKHTKPVRTRTNPKKPANEDVSLADPPIKPRDDSALRSEEFLKKVFSRYDILEFLATVEIRTAEQLIQVDKKSDSPVVLELIKWRTKKTGTQASPDSCIRCLYDWQKKAKDELEIAVEKDEIPQKKVGRPPKPRQVEAPEVLAALKEIIESKESGVDPISELSTMARSFLGTLNITTAHALLSTRTTEISRDFIKWREDMKMNPLKGSGAIATISGWKGAIRKKATGVENDDSANQVEGSAQLPSDGVLQTVVSPRSQIIPMSHPDILMGLPRRTFFVQNSCDPRCIYEFELSVRQSTTGGVGLYLCFLGAKQRLSEVLDVEDFVSASTSSSTSTSIERPAASFLPVLSDMQVSDTLSNATYGTFAISHPGCGLIDLSRYGVAPLPNSYRMEFRCKVQCFLGQGCASVDQLMPSEEGCLECKNANVLVEESSAGLGKQCLFYSPDPIEQGQVIELRFSPCMEKPDKRTIGDPFLAIVDRLALARAISVLSLADLKSLVEQASTILSKAKAELKEETQERGSNAELEIHVVVRRVHWLATRIVSSLDDRMETPRTLKGTDASSLIDDAKKLLMTMGERLGLCLYFKHSGKLLVLEELSYELLCDAVLRGSLAFWDDKNRWCSVTSTLLRSILRKASLCLLSNCSGNIESQKHVLEDIESYVIHTVKYIISPDKDLIELAFGTETELRPPHYGLMSREFFLNNYRRLPMDAVADLSHNEAYLNAMELCGEVAFEDDVKRVLYESTVVRPLVLATKMPWQQGSTIMRSIDDIKNGNAKLDEEWYINEIISVVHAIASSDLLEWKSRSTETATRPVCSYSRLADVARAVLEANPAQDWTSPPDKAGMPSVTDCALKLFRGLDSDIPANKAMPKTLPLFLAVVWPKLRAFGWCMEVGADPTNVIFHPPGHQKQGQRDDDRKRGLQRTERSRKRAKVERRVREAGFGEISKLTKRMFISAARDDFDPSNGASVRHTLKQFVSSVLSDFSGCGNEDSRRRLAVVDEAICECFDEIIPAIVSTNDNDSEGSFVEKRIDSSSYLMQVLLVLPSLLEQTGLSMRRIDDTVGVIRDLAQFISANNGELFEGPMRLCHEEYEAGYDVTRSFLVPRMEKLSSRFQADNGEPSVPRPKSADAELISEIVLPEDYEDLTDYSRTTLSQMLPCRATMNDIESKGRRAISVGHGGMVCRHCLARGGEGKYFFSSLGSLNTSANAVLAHLYKCKEVPDDLKARLVRLKARHEEDKKTLRYGSAAAFFSRLWMRLNSSCGIEGPEVYILPNQPHLMREESGVVSEGPKVTSGVPVVEFKSHTDLLTHIEKTPWNARADLRERIGQYYQCVAYGGELYMSNAMPKNFNSEWILSKKVPRDRLSVKRSLFLSG